MEVIAISINSEFLAEEIVRTLVGSLGLIAAVPISTFIGNRDHSLSGTIWTMAPLLGPETGDVIEHGHAD